MYRFSFFALDAVGLFGLDGVSFRGHLRIGLVFKQLDFLHRRGHLRDVFVHSVCCRFVSVYTLLVLPRRLKGYL